MTLNDLIKKANAVAGQPSSGDLELRLIDAITADAHGRKVKDIVISPYSEDGMMNVRISFETEENEKEKAGKVIYYSLLEQHTNGAWWYHKLTFTSREEAEEYFKDWIWWDKNRPKKILEHTSSLPKKTMVTYDFKRFRNPYYEEEVIAIL